MIDEPGPWGTGPFTLVQGHSLVDTDRAVIRQDPLTGSTPLPSPLTSDNSGSNQNSSSIPSDGTSVVAGAEPPLRLVRTDEPLDVPRILIDLAALQQSATAAGPRSGDGRTARGNGARAASAESAGTKAAASSSGSESETPPLVRGRGGEDVSDYV